MLPRTHPPVTFVLSIWLLPRVAFPWPVLHLKVECLGSTATAGHRPQSGLPGHTQMKTSQGVAGYMLLL